MLHITNEQFDTFRAKAMRAYEAEMCEHLRQFSPPLCKTLSDEQLLAVVKFGIARARQSGFDMRGPVRLWLENALLFGSEFNTDPQYPWMTEIVGNAEEIQMHRAERLFDRTVEYRRTVGGERDALTLQALKRIRHVTDGPLPATTDSLHSTLALIYPEKAAYLGDDVLSQLIHLGAATAMQHGITQLRGKLLVVTLMYAFGHGCIGDPIYPWIARTLADDTTGDPDARAARLERKAFIWLDHVLAHFSQEVPA